MKKLLILKFFVLCFCVFGVSAFGQSSTQIEKDLIASLKEMQKYSAYGSGYDDEKLSKANDEFEAKLLKYTKIPATLDYKFAQLNELMMNATSDDGKFRIYTWDSEAGGTMHEYNRVYQFQGADGKIYSQKEKDSEEDGGAGSFVTDIFSVDTRNGKIYIVCSTFIGSTNDHYQSANLYKINGDALEDKVKLIKTKSGLTDTLNFEYNFFSVVDRKERPVRLILFDKKTNTLKIPVILNDKEFPNGRVTNKFISYRFDGDYFVNIK